MATESLIKSVVDCQELCALITATLDFFYQADLQELLVLDNPVDADPFYNQTVEGLFDGRDVFFHDVENGYYFRLTKEMLLKAAYEYAQVYPEMYAEVGGADGYIPQIGMKILLVALYGWRATLTEVGSLYGKYLKID